MIKLVIGKAYIHKVSDEEIVITDIKRGQGLKPTIVHFHPSQGNHEGLPLPANEFKKTYKHAHKGEPKW